ncbi:MULTISPECIES: hypothetical protein [unclassified Nocardia]|uniref:hypothetical protein n=1 Tax=unclassified Nocardia TaxID=2637762 RepID=UPI0024A8EAE4|nr:MULTISPECIES: hypothetical protein [unclassified Nocardia]
MGITLMRNRFRIAALTFALAAASFATIAPATAVPLTPAEPTLPVAPHTAEPVGFACILIYPTPPECALASLSAGLSAQ